MARFLLVREYSQEKAMIHGTTDSAEVCRAWSIAGEFSGADHRVYDLDSVVGISRDELQPVNPDLLEE
jgi:hypothetical protein